MSIDVPESISEKELHGISYVPNPLYRKNLDDEVTLANILRKVHCIINEPDIMNKPNVRCHGLIEQERDSISTLIVENNLSIIPFWYGKPKANTSWWQNWTKVLSGS